MSLIFNGTEIKQVIYNGTELKEIEINGTSVFKSVQNILLDLYTENTAMKYARVSGEDISSPINQVILPNPNVKGIKFYYDKYTGGINNKTEYTYTYPISNNSSSIYTTTSSTGLLKPPTFTTGSIYLPCKVVSENSWGFANITSFSMQALASTYSNVSMRFYGAMEYTFFGGYYSSLTALQNHLNSMNFAGSGVTVIKKIEFVYE